MGNELSAQWTGDQSCFGRKQACPVRADDNPLVQNAWFPERMTVENLGGRWPSAYQVLCVREWMIGMKQKRDRDDCLLISQCKCRLPCKAYGAQSAYLFSLRRDYTGPVSWQSAACIHVHSIFIVSSGHSFCSTIILQPVRWLLWAEWQSGQNFTSSFSKPRCRHTAW
jgi:hypothetical protein